MKKIAIISFFSGYSERGVENWTYEIASRLSNQSCVIVFQSKQDSRPLKYRIVVPKVHVDWSREGSSGTVLRRVFADYWSLAILRFTLKILPNLWRENFDIFIPTNGGWQSLIVRLLAWIKKRQVVIVGHSGRGWDDRVNLLTFPDLFVSLTEEHKNWSRKANPFVKVIKIPNGVDLKLFSHSGKKEKINLKKPIILCVGALTKSKRIDLVIKALAQVTNVSLLIVGSGEMEQTLERQAKESLGGRFLITKFPHQKMPEVYRACDLFTLPSWSNEAFPLVYLEAMACNLPVVATNDLSRKEIIGEAGVLVEVNNIEKYAQALENALDSDWDTKPKQQADKFSWEKIASQYEKVLANL